jgi:hypothetical protein
MSRPSLPADLARLRAERKAGKLLAIRAYLNVS